MTAMTIDTTATGTYEGKTAERWREEAKNAHQRSKASWEHSDSDGFLSQWATDIAAREYELKAQLAENGAYTETYAVFDLDGNLIDAVYVEGDYGWSWMLLDADGRRDRSKGKNGFFAPSAAQKDTVRTANNAKKGFYEGTVKVPAVVDTRGGSITSVAAGIFPAQREITAASVTEIVDNGR
jgi:hypothetical protein